MEEDTIGYLSSESSEKTINSQTKQPLKITITQAQVHKDSNLSWAQEIEEENENTSSVPITDKFTSQYAALNKNSKPITSRILGMNKKPDDLNAITIIPQDDQALKSRENAKALTQSLKNKHKIKIS